MEACLHFRGAALNASEAGISRAKSDVGPLLMRVAKTVILPCGAGGIDQLESFDFRRREILHKKVEIFAAGKIAEFARFAEGEWLKSCTGFNATLDIILPIQDALSLASLENTSI